MYIEFVNDNEPTEVLFSSLDTGDCFFIRIGNDIIDKLYMKLDSGISQADGKYSAHLKKNAISMGSGELCFFGLEEKVIPIYHPNVKIVVSKYW